MVALQDRMKEVKTGRSRELEAALTEVDTLKKEKLQLQEEFRTSSVHVFPSLCV